MPRFVRHIGSAANPVTFPEASQQLSFAAQVVAENGISSAICVSLATAAVEAGLTVEQLEVFAESIERTLFLD